MLHGFCGSLAGLPRAVSRLRTTDPRRSDAGSLALSRRARSRRPAAARRSLGDVNFARRSAATAPGDRAVARSRQAPLIVKGEREGSPFVALTFNPRDSDLPLRVGWPVLLSRALDQLAPSPPTRELSLVVGQSTTLALAGVRMDQPVYLRGPRGELRSSTRSGASCGSSRSDPASTRWSRRISRCGWPRTWTRAPA